jgi:hypothetical protein
MDKTLEIHMSDMREQIIKEITAFASEYGHNVADRDVVVVEQLIDFLSIGKPRRNVDQLH